MANVVEYFFTLTMCFEQQFELYLQFELYCEHGNEVQHTSKHTLTCLFTNLAHILVQHVTGSQCWQLATMLNDRIVPIIHEHGSRTVLHCRLHCFIRIFVANVHFPVLKTPARPMRIQGLSYLFISVFFY